MARKSTLRMYFDYHAVAGFLHAAIPLAAGAAGAGYIALRSNQVGFSTSHLLVGLPMFIVGAAAGVFFFITDNQVPASY